MPWGGSRGAPWKVALTKDPREVKAWSGLRCETQEQPVQRPRGRGVPAALRRADHPCRPDPSEAGAA